MTPSDSVTQRRDLLQKWQAEALASGVPANQLPNMMQLMLIAQRPSQVLDPGRHAPPQVKAWFDQLRKLMDYFEAGKAEEFHKHPEWFITPGQVPPDLKEAPSAAPVHMAEAPKPPAPPAQPAQPTQQTQRAQPTPPPAQPAQPATPAQPVTPAQPAAPTNLPSWSTEPASANAAAQPTAPADATSSSDETGTGSGEQPQETAPAQTQAPAEPEAPAQPCARKMSMDEILDAAEEYEWNKSRRSEFFVVDGFDADNLEKTALRKLHGRKPVDEDRIKLFWEAPDPTKAFTVYRVESSEEGPLPTTPGQADLRAITTLDGWVDEVSLEDCVMRTYQVWASSGDTEAEALDSEPVRVGRYTWVAPMTGIQARYDNNKIVVQWNDSARGVNCDIKVDVFKARANKRGQVLDLEAQSNHQGQYDLSERAVQMEPGVYGTVHKIALRRSVKVYDRLEQSILSEPVDVEVQQFIETVGINVTPRHIPATPFGEEARDYFEITWEKPSNPDAKVFIYRSIKPVKSVDAQLVDPKLSAIEEIDIQDALDSLQAQNLNPQDIESCTVTTEWIKDATQMYFTPVTILNGQGRFGEEVPVERILDFQSVELEYRGDTLMIAFSWPAGASKVEAFYRQDDDTSMGPDDLGIKLKEMSEETYNKLGSMVVDLDKLEYHGTITLRGRRKAEVKPVIRQVHYAGTVRYEYALIRLDYYTNNPASPSRPAIGVLMFSSHRQETPCRDLNFALVANNRRLPLEATDGDVLQVVEFRLINGEFPPSGPTLTLPAHRVDELRATVERDPNGMIPQNNLAEGEPWWFVWADELPRNDYKYIRLLPKTLRLPPPEGQEEGPLVVLREQNYRDVDFSRLRFFGTAG